MRTFPTCKLCDFEYSITDLPQEARIINELNFACPACWNDLLRNPCYDPEPWVRQMETC